MKAKAHLLVGMTALSLLVSSCQKDLKVEEQSAVETQTVASNLTANEIRETALPTHKPIAVNINSNVAGYYETLPARYSQTTKKYPLILFIHGIGELGTGLNRLNCCGLPYYAKRGLFPKEFLVNGVYYNFIVVSPQFKKRPSPANVQSVIEYAKSKYRVDASRIYVAGLSMGGGSTWDYSTQFGQHAAAAVPICGGSRPTKALAHSIAGKYLPVWTISSIADKLVPIQWAKDWINWIDEKNPAIAPKTKLTVWTSENHISTWAKAFNPQTRVDGYSVYEWMLLHRRTGAVSTTPDPEPDPKPDGPTPPTSANKAPLAVAGPDQTIPLAWKHNPLVNGSKSSDPDGFVASFQWTKVSGPGSFTIVSPTRSQTRLNNLVAGTYVFRVTVKDNKGAVATDDVKITMTGSGTSNPGTSKPNPPATPPTTGNKAPVARAGSDQTLPVSWNFSPLINGSLSYDADGFIKSFQWTKVSGPSSYRIVNPNASQSRLTNLVPGTYVFRVTVRDNRGASASDDVRVTITGSKATPGSPVKPTPPTNGGNRAPVARAGRDQSIPLSWKFSPLINGTLSSDPDGWISSFQWTKISGPGSYRIVTPTRGQSRLTNLVAGTYVFRVTVRDNRGAVSTDDVTVKMY